MYRLAIKGVSGERAAYLVRSRGKKWIWAAIRAVFILGFSFVILYPLISMISRAFMEPRDLYDSSVLWLPRHFSFVNIKLGSQSIKYLSSFWGSLWSSSLMTIAQLLSCVTAGYALGRYRFPFRGLVFMLVMVTLIVPPQLTMISSYMFFSSLKILDTGIQLPMLLMSATGMGIRAGLFIYMFRQFFKSMPKETEEAAMVDGAGHFRTFWSVMLPGAVTIIVTVALFCFVWQWNDVFFTGLYDRGFKGLSGSVSSAGFGNYFGNFPEYSGYSVYDPVINKNMKSTVALMVVAPLIVLFLFMQRFFVESVERSGVVG